jgi:hypothetical protein
MVELEDIELAHCLADEILGQSLEDLSPPARKLLEAIHAWRPKEEFTRREVSEKLGWPWSQVWTYLRELTKREWALSRGGRPEKIALAWDGREGRVMLGLRSIGEIRALIGSNRADIGRKENR